jgi:GT2 family glycosyltransferase
MSDLKASVVVLVWNGIDYLTTCLDSVLAQDYPDLEVIVVDNGSTDGSPELVAERFPRVKLIRNERNLGFSTGNNKGLRAATGDMLVLLNHDTLVHPGWLTAMARALDEPATGIAGCKLLYPDGTIQHAGGYLYGPRGASEHIGRHAADDGRFDELGDAEFVTAASIAISRAALEETGLLDEGFSPIYYEDVDWCYRARAAGHRVVYQPQAVVTHYESVTADGVSHEHRFSLHHGRLRFQFKHRSLDQLLTEFGPAEQAWVAALDRSEELMAARRAYLATILALPGILRFRGSTLAEADALVGLLGDLRRETMRGLAPSDGPTVETMRGLAPSDGPTVEEVSNSGEHTQSHLLQELQDSQELQEHQFNSQVPLLGGLITAFRRTWGGVAAKWQVRPLVQQQSEFNALLVRYLEGQSRDTAENIRELTTLAEHLATLESALPEHSRRRAGKD